jgi:hypothetical protein
MNRRLLFAVGLIGAIAVVHYLLYLGLWGSAFAIGEGVPGTIPLWLRVAVTVLGAPLMLLPDRWFLALRPLLGDDSNSLFVVAGLNALLWGIALFFLFQLLIARRAQSVVATA